MAIKILSAKDFAVKLKATIQATGKLGFTEETAKTLGLSNETYIQIAFDDEEDVFYLIVMPCSNPDSFKVCSAGGYFYLPTSALFKSMGLDFSSFSFLFDLTREEKLDGSLGGAVYKMNKRTVRRKRKNVEAE